MKNAWKEGKEEEEKRVGLGKKDAVIGAGG